MSIKSRTATILQTDRVIDRKRRDQSCIIKMFASEAMPQIVWDKDTIYGLFISRLITWPCGTWPLEERKVFAKIRSIVAIIIQVCCMLMLFIEIASGYTTPTENIDSLMVITSALSGIMKVFCLNINAKNMYYNYVAAFNDYKSIDTPEKRDIVRRHAFMGRAIGCSILIIAYMCGAFFLFGPYYQMKMEAKKNMNLTMEPYSIYPLPSKHITSMITINPITYSTICVTEFMLLTVNSTANCGTDLFFIITVLHVCGQIQILKLDIAACDLGTGVATDKLRVLVTRHSNLLVLARLLVDAISFALLIQLFISCTTICIIGLQCILSLNVGDTYMLCKSAFVLVTLLLQLYSYSFAGDYLQTQTEDIGFYMYSVAWYQLPPALVRNLVFVIMRSQEPVQITAARFVPVNMETYMSILKTSFSYLSVLRVMLDA